MIAYTLGRHEPTGPDESETHCNSVETQFIALARPGCVAVIRPDRAHHSSTSVASETDGMGTLEIETEYTCSIRSHSRNNFSPVVDALLDPYDYNKPFLANSIFRAASPGL